MLIVILLTDSRMDDLDISLMPAFMRDFRRQASLELVLRLRSICMTGILTKQFLLN